MKTNKEKELLTFLMAMKAIKQNPKTSNIIVPPKYIQQMIGEMVLDTPEIIASSLKDVNNFSHLDKDEEVEEYLIQMMRLIIKIEKIDNSNFAQFKTWERLLWGEEGNNLSLIDNFNQLFKSEDARKNKAYPLVQEALVYMKQRILYTQVHQEGRRSLQEIIKEMAIHIQKHHPRVKKSMINKVKKFITYVLENEVWFYELSAKKELKQIDGLLDSFAKTRDHNALINAVTNIKSDSDVVKFIIDEIKDSLIDTTNLDDKWNIHKKQQPKNSLFSFSNERDIMGEEKSNYKKRR